MKTPAFPERLVDTSYPKACAESWPLDVLGIVKGTVWGAF